ncbi:MAG TPA: hypothetical protein VFC30_00415 [Solirubrobacteraceae bacterium]|nr:hypothetical protein [Solirubrobacteraceae bacterium]
MRWRFHALVVSVVALTIAGSVGASASPQPDSVSVHVQQQLSVAGNIHISFHATDRLPQGGYYYAVIVLKPYKGYTQNAPPPCATSSDMEKTDYGYPHPARPVALTLTPTKSTTGHWCRGGTYIGGIYAVPHAPPCNGTYPCRSENYEGSNCFELENGHRACGVVVRPKHYAYPEGLPKPIAQTTRIVAHFQVTF